MEEGGQLVTKAELLRAAWADTHVTDGVLKVCILEIRRALGDDSAAPRFIETVPRRGYRFIAVRTRPPRVPAAAVARGALVGRDGVLAQLEERLARARAGQRQVAFLSGEAGIGKTTVLDAFRERAAADPDLLVAHGACLEHYGATEAYLPVLDAPWATRARARCRAGDPRPRVARSDRYSAQGSAYTQQKAGWARATGAVGPFDTV